VRSLWQWGLLPMLSSADPEMVFRPIAALRNDLKMRVYREYAPLFRLPRAVHSNENPHF
jgi:hypothetical protein